jgi:hypothetical protein
VIWGVELLEAGALELELGADEAAPAGRCASISAMTSGVMS